MKLEAGKKYVIKTGDILTMEVNPREDLIEQYNWKFRGLFDKKKEKLYFFENGTCPLLSQFDVVSEYVEENTYTHVVEKEFFKTGVYGLIEVFSDDGEYVSFYWSTKEYKDGDTVPSDVLRETANVLNAIADIKDKRNGK